MVSLERVSRRTINKPWCSSTVVNVPRHEVYCRTQLESMYVTERRPLSHNTLANTVKPQKERTKCEHERHEIWNGMLEVAWMGCVWKGN